MNSNTHLLEVMLDRFVSKATRENPQTVKYLEQLIIHTQNVIQNPTQDPSVYEELTYTYSQMGDYTTSLKFCEQWIARIEDNSEEYIPAKLQKTELLFDLEQYQEALETCDEIIQSSTFQTQQDEYVYVWRGTLNLAMKNHTQAIKDFSNALKIDPNNYQSLISTADIMMSLNQPDFAKSNYQRVHELYPGDITALNGLIDAATELNDTETAVYAATKLTQVLGLETDDTGLPKTFYTNIQ